MADSTVFFNCLSHLDEQAYICAAVTNEHVNINVLVTTQKIHYLYNVHCVCLQSGSKVLLSVLHN